MLTDADNELMAPKPNVLRIMWTGTIWFSTAVIAIVVTLSILLASGWRPGVLPGGLQILWWVGVVITALALGLLGWSGCPILEVDVATASRNKTRTMQLGTLLIMVGGALGFLAIMLGPVS